MNGRRWAWAILLAASVQLHGVAALSWVTGKGFRSAVSRPEGTGETGFSQMRTEATGLGLLNLSGESSVLRRISNDLLDSASSEPIALADVESDGFEDLFFGQNFFGTASDITRDDAWQGVFRPVDAAAAGIRVDGEQRASAVADFDHDGRLDLLVAQNDGPLWLFQNRQARPGLRVTLSGGTGNPYGISAVMRVVYEDGGAGPGRAADRSAHQ